MRNPERESIAKKFANDLRSEYAITEPIEIGVVLGTGWGDKLDFNSFDTHKLGTGVSQDYFVNLPHLEGHERKLLFGSCSGKNIVALSGRIHLNEDPGNANIFKMVRLQTEVMLQLGVKKLIVTCAAGALPRSRLIVGDVVFIDSFVTLFAHVPF